MFGTSPKLWLWRLLGGFACTLERNRGRKAKIRRVLILGEDPSKQKKDSKKETARVIREGDSGRFLLTPSRP